MKLVVLSLILIPLLYSPASVAEDIFHGGGGTGGTLGAPLPEQAIQKPWDLNSACAAVRAGGASRAVLGSVLNSGSGAVATASQLIRGMGLVTNRCKTCHGATREDFSSGKTAANRVGNLKDMPPAAANNPPLTDEERAAMAAYLNTLP